jgi:hypothetical protein
VGIKKICPRCGATPTPGMDNYARLLEWATHMGTCRGDLNRRTSDHARGPVTIQ